MADVNHQPVPRQAAEPLPTIPDAFEWVERSWGPTLVCRRLRTFHHGWTTRLTAMTASGDKGAPGWPLLAEAAGVELDAVIRLRQVHGARVVHATGPLESMQEADAAVTREPCILLSVRVADCVPLLIGDPTTGSVAAVHAGWRGTSAGVAVRVVEELRRAVGARPDSLVAAIGPGIGPCCYAVGPELRGAFLRSGWPDASVDRWFQHGGDARLDLWQANRDQLMTAGVASESVALSNLCTACHPAWFHSYRRDRERAGRQIAFIRAARS